jgi:hypothetical protein
MRKPASRQTSGESAGVGHRRDQALVDLGRVNQKHPQLQSEKDSGALVAKR